MKFVDVVWKNCCCSEGARKPFCTEARSAKLLGEVVAHRQLAGQVLAEVRIALAAQRDRREQLLGDVRLQVDVGADGSAILVDCVRRPEAREHLRARRVGWPFEQHAAVAIRVRLAGEDRILLASRLEADGDVERRSERAHLDRRTPETFSTSWS